MKTKTLMYVPMVAAVALCVAGYSLAVVSWGRILTYHVCCARRRTGALVGYVVRNGSKEPKRRRR